MKIAICDDSPAEIEKLKIYINEYKEKSGFEVNLDCFTSGTELLARMSAGEFYDLIFLDIVMPMVNGIDTAKEIFAHNKITQIIFLTTSSEYAVDSYSVCALDYIIKPINSESFKRAMEKFSDKRRPTASEEIIIQEPSSITKIALHNICFVEISDHCLIYHLSNCDIVKCRQSLSEIESALMRNGHFIKTHRSYVVNMDYIAKIEKDSITMTTGDRALVSRRSFKAVSDLFLENKFKREV